MRRQLADLPLAERIAQWPSHTQVKATLRRIDGKIKDLDTGGTSFGVIDVPPWKVQERLDLKDVKAFNLESHHGVPKEVVQDWLGLSKDVDSVPAYLTTMLEHRGRGAGLHHELAKKLGQKAGVSKWNLNQGRPPISDQQIIEALSETYSEAGLAHFWEVCEVWLHAP